MPAETLRSLLDRILWIMDQLRLHGPDANRRVVRGIKAYERKEFSRALWWFHKAVHTDTKNVYARLNRCALLHRMNDFAGARKDAQAAVRLRPQWSAAHFHLAACCYALQEFETVIEELTTALAISPQNAEFYFWRGGAHCRLGDLESGLKDLDEAIARDPQNFSYLQQRSIIRNRLGNQAGNQADFLALLSLDPSLRERADSQAFLAWRAGEYRTAITLCESLLEADSENRFALNLLAWLLATCPDAAFRHGSRAVQLAQTACELSSFADGDALETLAAACAECGDFPAAIRWQQQALQRYAPAEAQAWRFLLELYESGQPYRQHPIVMENPPQELRAANETPSS